MEKEPEYVPSEKMVEADSEIDSLNTYIDDYKQKKAAAMKDITISENLASSRYSREEISKNEFETTLEELKKQRQETENHYNEKIDVCLNRIEELEK